MAPSSSLRVCQVCKQEPFKYTCPRCRRLYCSVACFERHDADCVAAFGEAQFREAVKAAAPSLHERQEFKNRLAKIRQRLAESDEAFEAEAAADEGRNSSSSDASSDGDSDGADWGIEEERLKELRALAEADALSIEDLTPREAQLFAAALKKGELSQYLLPWTPWWLTVREAAFCEENAAAASAAVGCTYTLRAQVELPPVTAPAHVCCSASRTPSERVAFSMFEFLFAYCHVSRSFNGDLFGEEVCEAAGHFLAVARGAASNAPAPPSASSAVEEALCSAASRVLRACEQPPLGCADGAFSAVCLADVQMLLEFRDKALRALEEGYRLVEAFADRLRSGEGTSSAAGEDGGGPCVETSEKKQRLLASKELSLLKRKMLFIRAFCFYHWESNGKAALLALRTAAREKAAHLTELADFEQQRSDAREKLGSLAAFGDAKLKGAAACGSQVKERPLYAATPANPPVRVVVDEETKASASENTTEGQDKEEERFPASSGEHKTREAAERLEVPSVTQRLARLRL